MLSYKRLTRTGRFCLALYQVVCVLMTVLLAAIVVATPIIGRSMNRPLDRIVADMAAMLSAHMTAWALISIVLGVIIWSETTRMTPQEEAMWREIERPR